MCREEAKDLSNLFVKGDFPGVALVSVIKEVAPIAQAATDEILGVGEFQTKYFQNYPVYLDEGLEFYSYLGKKSLMKQTLWTWNPFTLYTSFKNLGARIKLKKVEGNLAGEGLVQGGILLISPTDGVVYSYNEQTGFELPIADITAAINSLLSIKAPFEVSDPAPVCKLKSSTTDCGCSDVDK